MKQLQDSVRNNYDTTTINYLTTTILCELYSQFYCENYLISKTKRTQKQMYYDIIDFVKQNTHMNLKVSNVATHFGYNEKYLSHLFSNIANIPLKQFILNVKMDSANFMLTDTNASIGDIALSLGFTDSHNFAKAYKKISGLTPTEYRNAFSKRLLYHV
ncbi:helix-turn-helix domain-containing protein [Anaerocolumna jejuensis]|uniref:helix-turn-helix domain-containing protein n=1 Tax=Anaerocolumna jejuensis TaxID=259063 RepID=UPI003F7BBBFE